MEVPEANEVQKNENNLSLIHAWLLFAMPVAVPAQFTCATNKEGTEITIWGYVGPDGALVIPDTINGLPVTAIGDSAFGFHRLTNVTIPNTIGLAGALNGLSKVHTRTSSPLVASASSLATEP